jgi:hypothetical protein
MAIVALVAAVAGLFVPVLLTVTALVLAILSLRAIRRSGGALTGRGLAVTAGITATLVLALNALTVVVVVRSWPEISRGLDDAGDVVAVARGFMEGRVVEWTALEEGDCYLTPLPGDDSVVEPVGCETPHDGEVIAVVALDSGSYPGEIQTSTDAARLCGERLQEAVDPDRATEDLNDVTMWPDAVEWDRDVRSAVCAIASAREGAKLTGSLRAAG